ILKDNLLKYECKLYEETGGKSEDKAIIREELMMKMELKHLAPIEYEFDMEGFEMLNDSCEKLERISEKFQMKNLFLSASFGKATGQLVRLSGVIHCLDQIMNILTEIDNINELDYEELTKILMDKTYSNIITRKNVEKAINVNEYLKSKSFIWLDL
ncbi:hypothetical protein BpHYR1_031202, partial [Brachionus plicatilis]